MHATKFIFESYELTARDHTIRLRYAFDNGMRFTETLILPASLPMTGVDSPDVQRALFALHLAGGASYYKALCPPAIEVRSGRLNTKQADFWNVFYTHGLGEFFYQNNIDFKGLISFPADGDGTPLTAAEPYIPVRPLVSFGGGKDSVVTMELLRSRGADITLFRLRGHHFIDELAGIAGLPLTVVGRQLDPHLFALNEQGAYNGHVPITGYITFLSIVVALLGGYDGVAFSNERSADYGNVEYLGMTVNHQWSKSLHAEHMQTAYIAEYVTSKVQYLNPLRPLSELKIAELFARYPAYFAHTTSCNRNWLMLDKNPHQGAWCGQCYKCAFIFALYAAMLPNNTAVSMYGKNLFEDKTLLQTYRQLWGAEGMKPFDCVGTPQEMQAAMYMACKKPYFANTVIGQEFTATMHLKNPEELIKSHLQPDFAGVPSIVHDVLQGAV